MLKRARKRSSRITLVLLGAAALGACGNDPAQRDLYANKQDCIKDWGDETKCEVAPASAGQGRTHSGSGFFWGPIYSGLSNRSGSSSSLGSARTGSSAIGSTSISRGGFGSSASSHSSGG